MDKKFVDLLSYFFDVLFLALCSMAESEICMGKNTALKFMWCVQSFQIHKTNLKKGEDLELFPEPPSINGS